tara:strand:- start:171 stop:389 length:219 start_codon:yes stop_codon:yes gene_type:complete
MIVLKIVMWYLIIGCVLDIVYVRIEKWLKGLDLLEGNLTDHDRMVSILLWPIGILFFINGFINTYFDNDEEN